MVRSYRQTSRAGVIQRVNIAAEVERRSVEFLSRFRARSFRSSDVDEVVTARVGIDARVFVDELFGADAGVDDGDVVVRRDATAELLQVFLDLFQLSCEVAFEGR